MSDEFPSIGTVETPNPFTLETVVKLPQMNLKTYCGLMIMLAREQEVKTGIYFLVPIVQSAHESACGNSGLARNHGNLFGIVATDGWKKRGMPVAYLPTWEEVNISEAHYPEWSQKNASYNPQIMRSYDSPSEGKMNHVKIELKREFRHYPSWRESFDDWGRLISGYSGYAKAYEFLKNKATVHDGIIELGKVYATDERYSSKLLSMYAQLAI